MQTTDETGKREMILAAALELFAERGFYGTAMPLVAEKAGVGAGTIYRYFVSKEELVNALYRTCKMQLSSFMLDAFPRNTPLREQFSVFWERLAEFARRHPHSFLFLELHHHAPYLDEESRTLGEQGRAAFYEFFLEGQQQKAVKLLPPPLLGMIVWGAFVGVFKASWSGECELTPETLKEAERCCWEAIRN